jgi:predicted Zn-dependent peptidase
LFSLEFFLAANQSFQEIDKAALEYVDKMARAPVPAAALERAKRQTAIAAMNQFESLAGSAAVLAGGVADYGSIPEWRAAVARMMALSGEDLQNVVRRTFVPTGRVLVRMSPQSAGAAR